MFCLSQGILILVSILLTEAAVLRYYITQNPLPINSNKIVIKLFNTILILTVADLVVTIVGTNNILQQQRGLLYVVISIYYLMYQLLYTHILEYILIKCKKTKYLVRLQNKEPAFLMIVSLVLFVNYSWEKLFYLGDNGMYVHGDYYLLLHIIPFLVLLYSVFIVIKQANPYQYKGIFYGLLVLLFGTVMQFFITTYALEVCLILSVSLLYVTTESPAFFESEDIKGVYNTKGFVALINEYIEENRDYYVYGINIHNFDSLKKRYGVSDFYVGLECFSEWLKEQNKTGHTFYTNNDCFNLVTTEPLDSEALAELLFNRTKKSFKVNHIEMYIWAKLLIVETTSDYCKNGSDIINVEKYALERYSEKDSQVYVNDEIFKQVDYNSRIEEVIQECLEKREIEIYIQPIYNATTQRIDGGEILTRIKHPKMGLIMPNDFISLAEKNGTIFDLSLLIFEKTCHYLSQHDLKRYGITFINVNCSPVQFQNVNLVTELKGISDKYGVFFSIFDFEVTESNMNSENLLHKHIEKMNEYQASASLDDFGKGGSDIFRLINYDFTLAKLDKSLVWKYFENKTNVMTDIISMFKHENLKIVAEGVETAEMVEELTRLGCDYLQGYYFSKPLPCEEFMDFVETFNNQVKD